jgi:hypothetical protein
MVEQMCGCGSRDVVIEREAAVCTKCAREVWTHESVDNAPESLPERVERGSSVTDAQFLRSTVSSLALPECVVKTVEGEPLISHPT